MTNNKSSNNADGSNEPKGLAILFADDERSLQELMKLEIPRMGHRVTVCPDGMTAAAALEKDTFDCLLVDLDMPGLNGIDVIAKAKELCPDAEAVVLTGKSSLETAISALRHGAFDYLTKPCKLVEIEALMRRVQDKRKLTQQYRALKRRLERIEGTPRLVGTSAGMDRVRTLIAKVAPTQSTVLILGETGTGKELVARAVHDQSPRAGEPFVAINCGALPETLIESELFGHRKGAFTGADEHRVGLFEVANNGTIFLDEIGELPKAMQAKLLRVLESREIRRVGENRATIVDVRVVCATHRDLPEMVATGDFREDLMYRINTFEIFLPPLRDRVEDIAELAEHLLGRFRGKARAAQSAPCRRRDRDAQVARLAGQRARAGQRDRARHDSVRRRPNHGRTPAVAFQSPPTHRCGGRITRARSRCATWRCRRFTRRWSATAAASPRRPTNSASA